MARTKPTGWVGWSYFASAMMLVVGGLHVIAGLVSLFKAEFYEVEESGLLAFDFTVWGWVHIALGALLVAAAVAVMMANVWGRMLGLALAALSAIASLAFLEAHPVWSVTTLVADVMVIYALTAPGVDARS